MLKNAISVFARITAAIVLSVQVPLLSHAACAPAVMPDMNHLHQAVRAFMAAMPPATIQDESTFCTRK